MSLVAEQPLGLLPSGYLDGTYRQRSHEAAMLEVPPLATPSIERAARDEATAAPVVLIPSLSFEPPAAGLVPFEDAEEAKPARTIRNKTEGWWGTWSTQVVLRDLENDWDAPVSGGRWHTDEAMRLELPGPLFAFTQLGVGCDSLVTQQVTLVGRTGLGWKCSPWAGSELLLRGGPVVVCSDPLRPELVQEHSEVQLEVQYHCPLPGPLRLEYQGAAIPGLTATQRARLNQDLRFAVPLGSAGQLRLGAKHSWQDVATPLPWTSGMELYVGLSLGR
ncbi:MAG TPA: hypothetical protein VKI65_09990 [Gemmataceae bacterium]|nr:hypothetical protein [Gemmataceae bacterium]